MRSRYRHVGIGRVGAIGQGTFSATPTPTCPPGQHWVEPTQSTLKGISECVPNVKPLVFHAPAPPTTVHVTPLTLQPPATVAPSPPAATDRAAEPSPPLAMCPPVWPWWYALIAAGVGAGIGYYAQRNQKKVRKNAGRIAGRALNRAGDVAIARLLG